MPPSTPQSALVPALGSFQSSPDAQPKGAEFDYKGKVEDGKNDPRSIDIPRAMVESGHSGDVIWRGIIQGNEYNPVLIGKKALAVWDQMRKSDATVRALLNIMKGPIVAAEWSVEAASDSAQDQEIAEFVKYNLFSILSWEDVLREALTSFDFGFWVGEKVYAPAKWKGKTYICIKKIGTRKADSIYSWTIPAAVDPAAGASATKPGEAPGVTQLTKSGEVAYLPIDKLIIVTHDREANNYEGTSVLRPAYIHWSMKQKMYKIDLVAQEKHGVGVPIIEYDPNLQNDDLNKAIEAAQNIRASEKGYILKPKGSTLEMLDMKSHQLTSADPMIQHHNRQILMAGLAAFMEMGSHAGSGGAHASSNDQSRMFELNEEMEAKNIAKTFMNMFVKELVDLNYSNVEEYPVLNHGKIGEDDVAMLSQAIYRLVQAGAITMDADFEDYIRSVVGGTELPDAYKNDYDNRPRNQSATNSGIIEPEDPDNAGAGGKPVPTAYKPAAAAPTNPAAAKPKPPVKATEADEVIATAKQAFDRIEAILATG